MVVVALVGMGACGSEPQPSRREAPTATSTNYESSWRLRSGQGPDGAVTLVEGADISLVIADGNASGRAACNSYAGSVEISGSSFQAGGFGMTEMGCDPRVTRSQDAYMAALSAVDTIERAGDTLTLSGDGVELVFESVPSPPTRQLVGTSWHLESLLEGRGEEAVASSAAPADLRLSEDGTFNGSTGCRGLAGEWVEAGYEIHFTSMSASGECSKDLEDQDGLVVGVLGDGFTAEIDQDQLTVVSARGEGGLIYRASASAAIGDEGSSTLEVTCLRDGTQLHTPVVEARSDGVHVRVDNLAGEGVSINGLGWDFEQGISEAVLSTPPGTLQIACWPYRDHNGKEPDAVGLKITDPDGHWIPTELDCGDGMISQSISDFAAGASGRKGDPVEIVRSALRGLEPGDAVERAAYPDQDEPVVRIVRRERVIGVAGLSRSEEGGYLFGGFSSCADARLGQG